MLIKQPDRPDNISANANCYASRKVFMSYLDCLQSFSAADERSFPADIKTIFQQANRPVSGEENGYEHGKKFMNSITLHTRWLTQPAVHCVPPGRRSLGWVWWRRVSIPCAVFSHSFSIQQLFWHCSWRRFLSIPTTITLISLASHDFLRNCGIHQEGWCEQRITLFFFRWSILQSFLPVWRGWESQRKDQKRKLKTIGKCKCELQKSARDNA